MSRPTDDSALVERARRGDAAAYQELVRAHQDLAFRTALVLTSSAADAEEAAQDGFVKAWRALPRFRAGAPFRPWLLAIVANEARQRRRAAGRRAAWTARLAVEAAHERGAPGADVAVLARERRAEVLTALAQLGERDRSVVVLRHLVGLSEAETARVLRCRPGTVKSRLSRALARLEQELEADR